MVKYAAIGLLGAALLSGSALAQSTAPATAPAASNSSWMTQMKAGEWRAFKFDGLDVYNNNNDKIGDIKDLIMGSDGKVSAAVIGVGGFLGMGEHYVAVPFSEIKFVLEPRSGTAATTSPRTDRTTTGAADRTTTTTTTTTTAANRRDSDYPDHAIFNMTKDQLKAAPEFKYNSNR